jgi:malonyl-ACP O-methyltransferase BioC
VDTPSADQHHTQTLKARFSSAASVYSASAGVQDRVATRLMSIVPAVEDRTLEVGCGSGILTVKLISAFPGATIDALDISESMIDQARRHVTPETDSPWRNVRWIASDLMLYDHQDAYPLIVSSSALQWLLPLDMGLRRLTRLLTPGGALTCAVMVDGTLGELRASRLRVAPGKPPLGRLPTANEFVMCATGAGLTVEERIEEEIEATYGSATEFLDRLNRLGVTGGLVSRGARPLSRGEIRALVADYEEHCASLSGGVYATYRVLYLKARAPIR